MVQDKDAFAHETVTHPALQDSFAIAPDVYEQLFDGHIDGSLFNRWLRHRESWPLDIVGGPGSGKVGSFWLCTLVHVMFNADGTFRPHLRLCQPSVSASPGHQSINITAI
jgi:hypothetical protein